MRVAYLRGVGPQEDLQTSMTALEGAGCDRVVVDSTPRNRPESSAALNAFLARMKPGDSLVVTELDQLGSTTQRLLDRLADLIDRGIRVETLSRELDTGDPSIANSIKALRGFDRKARLHRAPIARPPNGDNSPGRPRRLADPEIARARAMVEAGGRPIAEVARALGVSRATLYRSLRRE